MLVQVREFNPARLNQIEMACSAEWPFEADEFSVETGTNNTRVLTAKAFGTLCGGESDEEFTDRLAMAIWKANQGYCEVEVQALYLEDLPYEQHVREKEDYQRLMKIVANGGEII